MSSHRLSVSGERPYTITAGGGPHSSAQFPSKPEDRVSAQLGQVGSIRALLPNTARVERYQAKGGGTIYSVLVVEGQEWEHDGRKGRNLVNVTLIGVPEATNHPLSNVDVRKDDGKDPLYLVIGDMELVETVELAPPPTE